MTRDELIEELKRCPYNCEVEIFVDGDALSIDRIDNAPGILLYPEE
jgi:hypothetical protein